MTYLSSVSIPTEIPLFQFWADQIAASKALRVAIDQPWSNRVSLIRSKDEYGNVSIVVLFYVDDFTPTQIEEYKAIIIAHLPT